MQTEEVLGEENGEPRVQQQEVKLKARMAATKEPYFEHQEDWAPEIYWNCHCPIHLQQMIHPFWR